MIIFKNRIVWVQIIYVNYEYHYLYIHSVNTMCRHDVIYFKGNFKTHL